MNFRLTLLVFSFSVLSYSQQISIKNYGAKGDGKTDDSPIFDQVIAVINKNYASKKIHSILFIPAGEYILSQPIKINSYISLIGESANTTSIRITSTESEGIIIEDNRDNIDPHFGYNTISNITVLGPDYSKNPFAWKNIKQNNPKSIGIRILGIRNRIDNCIVDGFTWSGIEVTSSYYNYITQCFIKNNRIGITINKTSTSAFINNNEIRTNAIGILINDQSYAIFINNNLIENNISNFLDLESDENDLNTETTGKGILIKNSNTVFVTNNYFEQQYVNFALSEAYNNVFTTNFIALINLNSKSQSILKFYGNQENNSFYNNQITGATPDVDVIKMIIPEDYDYSSNSFDFGKEKNEQLKTKFKKTNKNYKNCPEFRN